MAWLSIIFCSTTILLLFFCIFFLRIVHAAALKIIHRCPTYIQTVISGKVDARVAVGHLEAIARKHASRLREAAGANFNRRA